MTRIHLFLILTMLLCVTLEAQKFKSRIELNVSRGLSSEGISKIFLDQMGISGYDGAASFLGLSTQYPILDKYYIFSIGLNYYFGKFSCLNATYGISESIKIDGFNDKSNFFLHLNCKTSFYGIQYALTTNKQYPIISFGPTLYSNLITNFSSYYYGQNTFRSNFLGLRLTFLPRVNIDENVFLGFNFTYNWIPNITIGPFTQTFGSLSSEFKSFSSHLSNYNYEINIGFRINYLLNKIFN